MKKRKTLITFFVAILFIIHQMTNNVEFNLANILLSFGCLYGCMLIGHYEALIQKGVR